jgi:hypothetical protein
MLIGAPTLLVNEWVKRFSLLEEGVQTQFRHETVVGSTLDLVESFLVTKTSMLGS